jgi:hypothetical protein
MEVVVFPSKRFTYIDFTAKDLEVVNSRLEEEKTTCDLVEPVTCYFLI